MHGLCWEVINVRAISWISSGNINREIQLIIDVIDYKMFKGKYLVGMLSAQEIVSQCNYVFFCAMIST